MLTYKIKICAILLLFIPMQGALLKLVSDQIAKYRAEEYRKNELTKRLYKAAEIGDLKSVKLALQDGADVNSDYFDDNQDARLKPLHIASYYGHIAVVEELLRAGAMIDDHDARSRTPLYFASIATNSSRYSVMKRLIEFGAELNMTDYDNRSPLYNAICHFDFGFIDILLKAGANYDFIKKIDGKICSPILYLPSTNELQKFSRQIELMLDSHISSLISQAATEITSNIPVSNVAKIIAQYVYELATKNTDEPNLQSNEDRKKIMDAVQACSNIEGSFENGAHVEKLEQILKNCSTVNFVQDNRFDKWTPLSLAANNGSLYAVKLLLKANADVNLELGENALNRAAWNNHNKIIKVLIGAGAQINKHRIFCHALDAAISRHNLESVFLLLKHNNKTGELDISALHLWNQKIALMKKSQGADEIIDLIAANFSDYLHAIATSFKYPLPTPLAKLIMEYLFLHTRYLEDEVVEPQKDAQSKCIIA